MSSFLRDNDDLRYYLEEGGVDWAALAQLSELGFRQREGFKTAEEALAFYREIAALMGTFAAEEVAPHAAELDRDGVRFSAGEVTFPPRLAGIFRQLGELGLFGMNLPRELGGMNAPMLLYFVTAEMLARGDVSVMSHYGFHGGVAMAMLLMSMLEGSTEVDAEGTIVKTRFAREIAEVAAGEAWGSMDITEPDAGSDMAALRTVAEEEGGRWFLTGQKIFITSGHGKYHLVIARTSGAPGDDFKAALAGLSLFLVPGYRDGESGRERLVKLDRVEEKLGHHASSTVAVSFDHAPAELLGKPGEGFRQMLEVMNHARLGVGFESIGLCEAAARMARAYAAERRSMGKPIERHEMIADYLDEMEGDIVGLRALAMHAAFHEEMAQKKTLFGRFLPGADEAALATEARVHRAAARRATPLLKYLAAEKAVEMARRCVQIHGGNGYMRELGAEKLLRDAVVMPIYEGTSQIQALMAMKDTLTGILRAPQDFVKRLAQSRWRALSTRDPLERRVAKIQQLALAAQQHLVTRTMANRVRAAGGGPIARLPQALFGQWDPRRDFGYAMLHAERLTRLLADEQIAEVLLAQAQRHPARKAALERHLDRAEPRVRFLHDEITTTGQRLLDRLAGREDVERGDSATG
jgi:alkylation response protein AidB-like acyl-CoA dehydrogenase